MSDISNSQPLAELWYSWINHRYINHSCANDKWHSISFSNFWQSSVFDNLSLVFERLTWERLCVVNDLKDTVKAVTRDEFEKTPQAYRFSCHDRAIDINRLLQNEKLDKAQLFLRRLIVFCVISPALSQWVSMASGIKNLKVKSIEFSRYRKGDFINMHSDTHENRVCNLVCYFDSVAKIDSGGVLEVYENQILMQQYKPCRNQVILLNIQDNYSHLVTPWKRGTGRNTLSIAFVRTT